MLSDFTPIQWHFDGYDGIKIYPIADLHIGSPECREDAWRDFVEKLQTEPRSYIVILGDMMDNGVTNSKTNTYTQTRRPLEQKRWLVEQLTPIKHKILCMVSGNHEARSEELDDNPLYDVACKLDIEHVFRENGAFLILRIGNPEHDGRRKATYGALCQHGTGGGGMLGSQVNKALKYGASFEGIDMLITGHTHKPFNVPDTKLVLNTNNNRVSERQFRVITATSWLKYGGYGFRKMYAPSTFSLAEILLEGSHKQIRVVQ